jgi:hypothetical protein
MIGVVFIFSVGVAMALATLATVVLGSGLVVGLLTLWAAGTIAVLLFAGCVLLLRYPPARE